MATNERQPESILDQVGEEVGAVYDVIEAHPEGISAGQLYKFGLPDAAILVADLVVAGIEIRTVRRGEHVVYFPPG